MNRMPAFGLLSASLLLLAGCVGEFRQTEPLRIQIDGDGGESRICADPCEGVKTRGATVSDKSEFEIENQDDVDTIIVVVDVEKVVVQADDEDDDANETADTGDASDDECVVLVTVKDRDTGEELAQEEVRAANESAQAEINVNIKGNHNIVVITEAVQGAADVNVAARGSSAGGALGEDDETASPTATSTYSPSPTTSTPY